jgi:hypothetical protein
MENLQCLDAVAAYKFGVLTERPAYLKFKDEKELYVLTDEGETALVTLTTRQGEAVLYVDDNMELELEYGKIYYLKPAPPQSVCLDNFDVQKYTLVDNVRENAVANDQLTFVTERAIDCLKTAIGNKKLRMSCWPLKNISIVTFLEKCSIPYHVVLKCRKSGGQPYCIFDNDMCIETNCNKECPLDFFKKIEDVTTNGNLFCDCKTLVKKVKHVYSERLFTGTTINWSEEKAFVIFNPTVDSDTVTESVLPVTSPDCIETVF